MGNRNSDILYEYLRSILYDTEIKTIDIDELDESFKKLGMGMQFLEQTVTELKEYSAALSSGNLSVEPPSRENFLCENLKTIHSNLNHLTWQAKQVAKGDYSQKVSFLGEFSEAFNTMTKQLSDREASLKKEVELERENKKLINEIANADRLTGIGNRYYFFRKADQLMHEPSKLTFCYCDLDHLKHVNDTFGHAEGDWYIKTFVKTIKNYIRKTDIFARIGGDEFCLVFPNCPKDIVADKMNKAQAEFAGEAIAMDVSKPYAMNFSFGIVEIDSAAENHSVEEILKIADAVMYEQKKLHKETI